MHQVLVHDLLLFSNKIACINITVNYHQWRIQDFPLGGVHPLGGGLGSPTWALFGKNVCENERIGFHRGGHTPGTPPRSANDHYLKGERQTYRYKIP